MSELTELERRVIGPGLRARVLGWTCLALGVWSAVVGASCLAFIAIDGVYVPAADTAAPAPTPLVAVMMAGMGVGIVTSVSLIAGAVFMLRGRVRLGTVVCVASLIAALLLHLVIRRLHNHLYLALVGPPPPPEPGAPTAPAALSACTWLLVWGIPLALLAALLLGPIRDRIRRWRTRTAPQP